MKRFKFKFEGIFEWDLEEDILLKKGEKYTIKGVLEGDSEGNKDLKIQEVEKQAKEKGISPQAGFGLASGIGTEIHPAKQDQLFISEFVTLEQFGGQGYYKLIQKGLKYRGSVIESENPVFSQEDVGKTFCGLLAHQNPLEPNGDSYFPGICGSRYCLVTEFISPKKIMVNFEFNAQSDSGYIFFDNSNAYRAAMNAVKSSSHGTLELHSGKTYVIPEFSTIEINRDLYIFSKSGANLKMGLEDYFPWSPVKSKKQDGFLFDLGGNSVQIGFNQVNFLPPHRRVKAAQIFYSSLFKSFPKVDQEAKIAVLDMNTTLEVDSSDSRYNQVGFGFGFLYSSEKGNYVIGKNIKHRGPGFMDFKANFGGGLYAVFENITTDFQDEESFASPRVKIKGFLKDNIFTITSGQTIYQIYTYDFGEGNVSHLLHFGRYTYVIDGKSSVINACQFKVRPFAQGKVRLLVRDDQSVYAKSVELHAGDKLSMGGETFTVIEKTRTYVTEWMEGDSLVKYAMCLKLDKKLPVNSGLHEFDIDSVGRSLDNGLELDAYLIYKSNYEFRTYLNTKFGDGEVLSSNPVGHLSYNHKEITLWAKNFKHKGFYRQSLSGTGSTRGYTLIDCEGFEGQFSPEVQIKKSGEMPPIAKEFLIKMEEKLS